MAVLTKRDSWRLIIGAILEWQHLFGAVIRLHFWNRVWCCLWIGGKHVPSIHNYFKKMTVFGQTSPPKTSSVLFPTPTTKTPHVWIRSAYLAMRWLRWGWLQWLPFIQYGSSGEPNYQGVYSYPNQSTLHFGSPERKTFLTYDGGSIGPSCWAF